MNEKRVSAVLNKIALRIAGIILPVVLLAGTASAKEKVRLYDKNLGWPGETLLGEPCYGRHQGVGPFDYADPSFGKKGAHRHIIGHSGISVRQLVEGAHFPSYVERLERGKTGSDPIGDIDYTIRAFPNHHRALWAMTRHYLRELEEARDPITLARDRRGRAYPPPECYFYRAARFNPNDGGVPTVFGIYLHRLKKYEAALEQYKQAEKMRRPNAELYYNIGLLYADMDDLDSAQKYADLAKKKGHPLSGLQRKIKRLKAEQANSKPEPAEQKPEPPAKPES